MRVKHLYEIMPFTDVEINSYYYDAVVWANLTEVTSGTSATTFSPNMTCTRGQVVTFIWRALGCPEPENNHNPFKDVYENKYYYNSVLWSYENGIVAGTSATEFSPEKTCTIGQVLTLIWRALGSQKADTTILPISKQNKYYSDAIAWATVEGLLEHMPEKWDAEAPSPRADIVMFLYSKLS